MDKPKSKYKVTYQFPVDPKDIKKPWNKKRRDSSNITKSWYTYKHPSCTHTTEEELRNCDKCYRQLITST